MALPRSLAFACTLLAATLPGGRVAGAQSACHSADQRSTGLIEQLVTYVTAIGGDDATSREALRLPKAAADEVRLVTDESVCAAAAEAYNRDRRNEGSGLSGRVYVIRIQSVYVVHDPEYDYNPALPGGLVVIVFDSSWKRLASY